MYSKRALRGYGARNGPCKEWQFEENLDPQKLREAFPGTVFLEPLNTTLCCKDEKAEVMILKVPVGRSGGAITPEEIPLATEKFLNVIQAMSQQKNFLDLITDFRVQEKPVFFAGSLLFFVPKPIIIKKR